MKTKEQLVNHLLKHYVNKNGDIDISRLDFGDFAGDIYQGRYKCKGNIHQSCHTCEGDILQIGHTTPGLILETGHKRPATNSIKDRKIYDLINPKDKNEHYIVRAIYNCNGEPEVYGTLNNDGLPYGSDSHKLTLKEIDHIYTHEYLNVLSKKYPGIYALEAFKVNKDGTSQLSTITL